MVRPPSISKFISLSQLFALDVFAVATRLPPHSYGAREDPTPTAQYAFLCKSRKNKPILIDKVLFIFSSESLFNILLLFYKIPQKDPTLHRCCHADFSCIVLLHIFTVFSSILMTKNDSYNYQKDTRRLEISAVLAEISTRPAENHTKPYRLHKALITPHARRHRNEIPPSHTHKHRVNPCKYIAEFGCGNTKIH